VLGPGRYLLGVLEILLLGGFAWLGASRLRSWLLPRFEGAPAGLATAVLALALLIWAGEVLGSFGVFDPLPYVALVAVVGLGLFWLAPRPAGGRSPAPPPASKGAGDLPPAGAEAQGGFVPVLVALLIAAIAVAHFATGVKTRLSTGMTGFDSTWYHGPFAAGFFQRGDTWDLHFIAPQFLAWFYPANSELFHAAGMLAFGRDILSPLLNFGWFVGCLVACWCIGRPYRVAPWSLALGAIALSVPALADQAGEARNDIVGIFFLLAGVAIALNAWAGEGAWGVGGETENRLGREGVAVGVAGAAGLGDFLVIGLAAGLAAGTKLNFLLPAAVLVAGVAFIAPAGTRLRGFAAAALAALAGGGYWYLRNLVHTGNPLPWIHHLGPVDLPAPEQALGGREAHSVIGYLTNTSVWSDWFLPGLHHGLWFLWPVLLAGALAGLLLAIRGRGALSVVGLIGLAAVLSWLIAPTSASGPDGMPRGFESGLRYLAPALILGLALLPAVASLTRRGQVLRSFAPLSDTKDRSAGGRVAASVAALVALTILGGYPVQRHYLASRYKGPTFTAPGLNAAFAWARDVSDARIATTSTRQYPLYGTDLSNHVQYLGIEKPHGGFEPPTTCRRFLRLLGEEGYDYVVTTRDRLEQGKPPFPPSAHWLRAAGARVVLKKPPTVVFKLTKSLDSSACR
jgi:hypothetical protein